MIKGINKQILEVTNPESPYFEKIIFFVRPQGQFVEEEKLKSEALKISTQMRKPPKPKMTFEQFMRKAVIAVLGVGAGISIAWIINYFVR